ncbi:S9 family peptidase [Massilia arenosa]|uniref:S9 family peptidase n=1 Tax=Zemynaea arenosa TaxID=2561931 RepID=A0A4Y9RN67_9BURK|nr:S9 family peptidase [Massilia arenosa]TFW10727.1 S9 family peptidase [Massilia arenosa]
MTLQLATMPIPVRFACAAVPLPLLLAAAASLAGTPAPLVPLVPTAAFVAHPTVSHPRLAPDGRHVAVIARLMKGGQPVPTVVTYALPDLKMVGALRLDGFEVPVDFYWISPTRLVVEKGFEVGTLEQPVATGELVAANFDGSEPRYLYGYQNMELSRRGDFYGRDYGGAYTVHIPQARNGHVIAAEDFWDREVTRLIDFDTFKATRKVLADVPYKNASFVLTRDGQPRFASVRDDHAEIVPLRWDVASATWVKGARNASFRPFHVDEAAHTVYGYHAPDGGPASVAVQAEAGGAVTVLAAADLGNVGTLEWTSRPEHIFATALDVGVPKARYLETTSPEAQLHQTLSTQFPGEYVHFIDFSDDGNALLFSVRSDRNPGEYYLFDRKAGRADLLFQERRRIDPAQMAERRAVQFNARDGLVLAGFLTLPRALPAGAKPPLVLLPHGGPHGPYDDWFYDSDAQFLANRGYAVLQVNYRGSGSRGRQFTEAGYGQWAGKILDDLADGVRWAAREGLADGQRVCVYGGSFGGYAALMLAAREPDLFKCAIGYAGVYDLPLLFENKEVQRYKSLRSAVAKYVGTDPAVLRQASPVTYAGKIRVPVLLVHGEADERAPVEHVHRMRAALQAAGNVPEWLVIEKEGHGFYKEENAAAFYDRLDAFLARALKSP